MEKESVINTGESRRLLDSAVDSRKEGRPEVVLNCLEITVQRERLGIYNLLVNSILIMKAVKSLIRQANFVVVDVVFISKWQKPALLLKITWGQSILWMEEELNCFSPNPVAAVLPTVRLILWVPRTGNREENAERKVTTEPFSVKIDTSQKSQKRMNCLKQKPLHPLL